MEVAFKFWQDINLSALQQTLDAQSAELIENSQEALNSRKKLAEQTKEFKKVPDQQKLLEFKNLLKAYQNEIDNITKRSKTAETAYLNLYKKLVDAPDPTPLIAAAVQKSTQLGEYSNMELENVKLKEQLAENAKEITALKTSESTIITLKQRLTKYEAKLDDMVQEKVNAKEEELREEMNEKIKIYKESEHALLRQVQQTKDQLVAMQNSHNMTQSMLSDNTQKYDDEVSAKLAELDIVVMDLEQAQLQIAYLTRDNETLKKEISDTHNQFKTHSFSPHEEKNKLLEIENSRLKNQLQESHHTISTIENTHQQKVMELETQISTQSEHIEEMNHKLEKLNDYDMLKKELDVLKLIEFPDSSIDLEGNLNDSNSFSLERLMLDRNKKLQNEITVLRLNKDELLTELDTTKKNLEEATVNINNQQELISRLEEDLMKFNQYSSSNKHLDVGDQEDSLSRLLSMDSKTRIDSNMSDNKPKGSASSIIPILTSQRDRYRQRNNELEEQIRKHNEILEDNKMQLETLQNDNIKLYEKLRYTQSFQESSSPTSPTSNNNSSLSPVARNSIVGNSNGFNSVRGNSRNSNSTYVDIPMDSFSTTKTTNSDRVTNKYRPMYEGSLDPFQRFHKQEEARRLRNLNPAERVALNMTKMIVMNKYSRWIFLVYSGMLHVLVIFTLYQISNNERRY